LSDSPGMVDRIVHLSAGSFLWVRLVLEEMENAYTDEDIEDILKEVPGDLGLLYARMIRSIDEQPRRRKLAWPILTWVVLASRPLSIQELQVAVKLDAGETPRQLQSALPTLCGQFVYTDQNSRVYIIHETAREFLLNSRLDAAWKIDAAPGHSRLAALCLHLLSGQALKVRLENMAAEVNTANQDGILLDYAAAHFSEHLHHSNPEADGLVGTLALFFRTNVLAWMELICYGGDLGIVISTGRNLKQFLAGQRNPDCPTASERKSIGSWATDLLRIATRFGKILRTCPSAIHGLIPPFCPTRSAVHRTFATGDESLVVRGASEPDWDECIARIAFDTGVGDAFKVAYGDQLFAIGLRCGTICIYDGSTTAEVGQVQHPGTTNLYLMLLSSDDKYLASGTADGVLLWDTTTRTQLYRFEVKLEYQQPLSFSFYGETLLLVSSTGQVISL